MEWIYRASIQRLEMALHSQQNLMWREKGYFEGRRKKYLPIFMQ